MSPEMRLGSVQDGYEIEQLVGLQGHAWDKHEGLSNSQKWREKNLNYDSLYIGDISKWKPIHEGVEGLQPMSALGKSSNSLLFCSMVDRYMMYNEGSAPV